MKKIKEWIPYIIVGLISMSLGHLTIKAYFSPTIIHPGALYELTGMHVVEGPHAIWETDEFEFWGWSNEYIVGQRVTVDIKKYVAGQAPLLTPNAYTQMKEIISNNMKSWIVNDTTMLYQIKINDKKYVVVRVGDKTNTVEQMNVKQMKDKYKLAAW